MHQLSLASQGVIRSVSYSQREILRAICTLHCEGGIELDMTWGRGNMFSGIPWPTVRLDINPRPGANVRADFRSLPLRDSSISSIMFDPPWAAGGGGSGLMTLRYGCSMKSVPEVWDLYRHGLTEAVRVLKRYGTLIVKCQDIMHGRTQYMTHVEIMNIAIELGLYPRDIFILISRTRPIQWNLKKQHHARKYHSYFLCFEKANRNVPYSTRKT